jgi:hypothetical protein
LISPAQAVPSVKMQTDVKTTRENVFRRGLIS